MGVWGLTTCVQKNVPNGVFPVDIVDEIKKWKTIHNEPPIIVMDLQGLLRIFANRQTFLFSGRHQISSENYEHFLKTLIENGAEIAVFSDGPVKEDKVPTWITRKNDNYESYVDVFNGINSGQPPEYIISKDILRVDSTALANLINISKNNSKYYYNSMYIECDAEIAQFATKNNALAILAEDSDFLIFEGNWRYWSAKSLDIHRFTTCEYNRSGLREFLNLSVKQMPMLATIAGNDFTREEIKEFRYTLGRPWEKIPKAAETVRNIYTMVSSDLTDSDLKNVAEKVLQINTHEIVDLLRRSLTSYNIDFDTPKESDPLLCLAIQSTFIYSILTGKIQVFTYPLFDCLNPDFMPYLDIVLPIFRRQVGVVINHKKDISPEIRIFMKKSHKEEYMGYEEHPDYPDFPIPPLIDILDEKSTLSIDIRWDILLWTLSVNGVEKPNRSEISPGYYVVSLALNYLVKIKQITIFEADAILLTVDKAKKKEIPLKIMFPKFINSRMITVAHLYCRVHNSVLQSFQIMGLEKCADFLIFDGVFFCNLINEFKNSKYRMKPMLNTIDTPRIYASEMLFNICTIVRRNNKIDNDQ